MTNQEAIDELQYAINLIKQDGEDWIDERDIPILEMAIHALEKQIPTKVRITTSTKRCSVCGRQLSGIGNIHPERNYCQGCGQAIDWRKSDDEVD